MTQLSRNKVPQTKKKGQKSLTNQRGLIYNGFLQVMACFDKLCLASDFKSVGHHIASLQLLLAICPVL